MGLQELRELAASKYPEYKGRYHVMVPADTLTALLDLVTTLHSALIDFTSEWEFQDHVRGSIDGLCVECDVPWPCPSATVQAAHQAFESFGLSA